jgi:hypothetical protein
MKALGLALIAALAIGCGSSPTAPSSAIDDAASLAVQEAKHPHNPDTQQLTLYFFSDDIDHGGNVHVVGVQVTMTTVPASGSYSASTGKQASVTFDVPKNVYSVHYSTVQADGWCQATGDIDVPFALKANWILIHKECP